MFRWASAPRLIASGFATLMLLGMLLLKLPASTQEGNISWLNALFVSVSASSVTGLSTVEFPTTFTTFGETIIMGLMQVGGIGIMTTAALGTLLVGRRVGFKDLLVVREELGTVASPRNTLRLVGQIVLITFAVELVGAAMLAVGFSHGGLRARQAVFQGLFHAVMAFCNSGFATLPKGDLATYRGDPLVNGVIVAVIVLGGLGFPVLINLYRYPKVRYLTLHSKIVLVTTASLIVVGFLSFALLEWRNPATLGGEPLNTKLLMSLFQSVTPRTAGFQTVDYSRMNDSTLSVQIGLMFFGAGPISTGGGIKVTTLALMVLILVSQVRGHAEVSAFGRRIPRPLIAQALSLLTVVALLLPTAAVALMVSDNLPALPALFEVVSAFSTVGLSMNVTPTLSDFGKILIMVLMFLGRVGPVTFVLALSARTKPRLYGYPEEDVAIG